MTDPDGKSAKSGKSSRGPGRPSNAELAADLAGQVEQTLNGLADLLEPPEGEDVETIAGVIRRDARTIAVYCADLAEKHTAAMGGIKRVLVASGAIRAFGPIVGMLLGRAFTRRGDLEAEFEPDEQPMGAPDTAEVRVRRIADTPQA